MLLVEITTQALNQYKNLSAVSWTQKDEERMLLVLLYELLWGESLWVLRSICVSWMWTVDIKHETHAGTHVSFTAAGHHTGVFLNRMTSQKLKLWRCAEDHSVWRARHSHHITSYCHAAVFTHSVQAHVSELHTQFNSSVEYCHKHIN